MVDGRGQVELVKRDKRLVQIRLTLELLLTVAGDVARADRPVELDRIGPAGRIAVAQEPPVPITAERASHEEYLVRIRRGDGLQLVVSSQPEARRGGMLPGVADGVSQVLPGVFALAGVAVSFGGNAFLESRRMNRARRDEEKRRSEETLVDFLQTLTDIVRTLREAAERHKIREGYDNPTVAAEIDQLVAQARRQVIVLRMVHVEDVVRLIREAEEKLTPLHVQVMRTTTAEELVGPARELVQLRDRIIDHVRFE